MRETIREEAVAHAICQSNWACALVQATFRSQLAGTYVPGDHRYGKALRRFYRIVDSVWQHSG